MYVVEHYGYCGMQKIKESFDDCTDAREFVAERLHSFRQRFPVQTITKGTQWEIMEPDGCMMVPDSCGSLYLSHETWECKECGSQCETQSDALNCCNGSDDENDY